MALQYFHRRRRGLVSTRRSMENGVQSWALFLRKRRTGQSIAHGVEQTGPPPWQITTAQSRKVNPNKNIILPLQYTPLHSIALRPTPHGQHRPMLVINVSYVAQWRHAVNISPQATETLCCMWGTRQPETYNLLADLPHHPPHLRIPRPARFGRHTRTP